MDGSAGGGRALEWALREGRHRGWALEVITTFGHGRHGSGLAESTVSAHSRQAAEAAQTEQLHALTPNYEDVTVEARVIDGPPVDRLVEASKAAALLVVGSHGFGRVHDVLVGSVAAGCIRHALCPVVVLPAPHPEPTEPTPMRFRDGLYREISGPLY